MTNSWVGIGLMSGTSHDGVDLAACRFTADADGAWTYAILAAETIPYNDDWRQRLLALPTATAEDFAKTDVDLGHLFGLHLRQFALRHGIRPDFVASHGHTIFHQPWRHFTSQIGSPETIVSHLSCPLVADFRTRDVAAGGQGAPLVPFSQLALFPNVGLCLNLGGIANLTVFAQRAGVDPQQQYQVWQKPGWQYLAYDLCAANLVLNHLANLADSSQTFDRDGALAASGELDPRLFLQLQQLDYYHNHPPRSLGREYALGKIFPLLQASGVSLADQAQTYVQHMAWVLGQELDRFGIRNTGLLVTGGGAHNPVLMQALEAELTKRFIHLEAADHQLIDFAEALHFAFLGLMALRRVPNVLHAATGARIPSIAGSIHLPEAWQTPLL